jgi:hypothetical protein
VKKIELANLNSLEVKQTNLAVKSNITTGTKSQDLLIGTSANEPILGFAENDILVGKDGNDTLVGGTGNDSLETGRGNNLLLGNEGNDTLMASNNRQEEAGNNVFNGGAGDDFLISGEGDDLLVGGSGINVLFAAGGNDNLLGGAQTDFINGGLGNDRINGKGGNDELEGGDGNDLILGGNGSDLIRGLEGLDTLDGGGGADFFNLIPDTGEDAILNFEDGRDKLVLTASPRFGSELTFEKLSIAGDNNNTTIAIAGTQETLVILKNTAPSAIDANDFMQFGEPGSKSRMPSEMNVEALLSQMPTIQDTNQSETEEGEQDNSDSTIPSSVGSVTSQGAEVVNANEARNRFGVDGSDITVGVLSDSFDRNLLTSVTAEDDVATGDLPGEGNPNGYTNPVTILDDSADNSFSFPPSSNPLIDEGRAMTQIISDIAPGADILFHTAFNGAEDFAEGIDELVAAGADIIVDDVGYSNEPFFQDGVIAQAANRAVEAGVPFFSSSGNDARNSYESDFRLVEDSNSNISGLERYSFHDFNPNEAVDIFQNFTLEPGAGIDLSLQWDEPFASAGGKATTNDLDVFVLDANNNVVSIGAESNVGSDAVELVGFSNTTEAAAEYKLLIGQDTLAGGEAPTRIKYIDPAGGTTEAEYFTNSATTFGHPNADGVSAVGASFYQTPNQIESFSSGGVVPILFDEEGNRLPEEEIRQTVDIIAPDGANTTFFLPGIDPEEDGFPNFPGTSAASPHAAGVAALLLDAVPDATPQEVYGALEQTAIDLDDPFTQGFDTGFDTATGFGLIQADLALEVLQG